MDSRTLGKSPAHANRPDDAERQEETGWPGKRALSDKLSSSGGATIPTHLQSKLERSLGGSLDAVRVHTDSAAADAAQDLGARAFTVGQSIYFGKGQYDPSSRDGQRLLFHEVAHTHQQRGATGSPQLAALDVSTPGDSHELEAENFAQSLVDAPRGRATPAVTAVSRGVIQRVAIQRDALDGGVVLPTVVPIVPAKVDPAADAADAVAAVRAARAQGPAAIGPVVQRLRQASTGPSRGAIDAAIKSELTPEERKAAGVADGAPSAAPAASAAPAGATPPPSGPAHATPPAPASTPAPAAAHTSPPGGSPGGPAAPAATPAAPATAAPATAPAAQPAVDGGAPAGGVAARPAAPAGATSPIGAHGTPAPAESGEAKADNTMPSAPPPETLQEQKPHAAEHDPNRELIEQELAFHEKWKVYAEGGAGGRAAHLLGGLFLGDKGPMGGDGAGRLLTGDLAKGGLGAATQFGTGLMVKLAVLHTPLSKIPGAGNIIGGLFSGAALFANNGAGFTKYTHEIGEGFKGAFDSEKGTWLRLADLISGVKSTLELVGHICNVLSGAAYVLAGVGALATIAFPVLAPAIPVLFNFARGAGGVASVCLGIANILSPFPAIFHALHQIFSSDDPIKLVGDEKGYHERVQGAIATFAAGRANSALEARGSKTLGLEASGKPDKGFFGSAWHETKAGASTAKDAFSSGGVARTASALGMTKKPTTKAEGKEQAESYFNPKERVEKIEEALPDAKSDAKRAGDAKNQADNNLGNAQKHLGRIKNPGSTADAQATVASLGATAHQQAHAAETANAKVEHIESQAAIPRGFEGESVGGSSGDAADALRGNYGSQDERKKEEREKDESLERADTIAGRETGTREPVAEPGPGEMHEAAPVKLTDPPVPGGLEEIDRIDEELKALGPQIQEIHGQAAEAQKTQQQASAQSQALSKAAEGGTQFLAQNTSRSAAAQGAVQSQNAEVKSKSGDAQSTVTSGVSQGSTGLSAIRGTAATIEGALGSVPQNRFIDVSGTRANAHQLVAGIDQITGANAGAAAAKGQAAGAMQQREAHVNEAKSLNASTSSEGQKLVAEAKADAGIAATSAAQAGQLAAEAKAEATNAGNRRKQLEAERAQKWQALLSWAATHRQMREQGARREEGHKEAHE
jgi:hypothetical protein